MSSSLNFHNAISITMEAFTDGEAGCIYIKAVGDHHWDNRHTIRIFVKKPEDYPHFARAVEAFNEALEEFYAIKAEAEARANEIDEKVPF